MKCADFGVSNICKHGPNFLQNGRAADEDAVQLCPVICPVACQVYHNLLLHSAGAGEGANVGKLGATSAFFGDFSQSPAILGACYISGSFRLSFGFVWFRFIFVIDAVHGRGG